MMETKKTGRGEEKWNGDEKGYRRRVESVVSNQQAGRRMWLVTGGRKKLKGG